MMTESDSDLVPEGNNNGDKRGELRWKPRVKCQHVGYGSPKGVGEKSVEKHQKEPKRALLFKKSFDRAEQ